MSPLADIADVTFLSLQKRNPAARAIEPPQGMILHSFAEDLRDFVETAILITAPDLMISVETALAHLAGTRRKPN
jgi:hypothetical protein